LIKFDSNSELSGAAAVRRLSGLIQPANHSGSHLQLVLGYRTGAAGHSAAAPLAELSSWLPIRQLGLRV